MEKTIRIVIFGITDGALKRQKVNVKDEAILENAEYRGIEFCASIFGVHIVGYSDFENNVQTHEFVRIPFYSVKKITEVTFDYIILNRTDQKLARTVLIAAGVENDQILSFESQRRMCFHVFKQSCAVSLRQFKYVEEKLNICSQVIHIESAFTDEISLCEKMLALHDQTVKKVVAAYERAKEYEYSFGSNWKNFLLHTRREFFAAMERKDSTAISEMLKSFFRNHLSTGIFGGKEAFASFKFSSDLVNNFRDTFNVWKNSVTNHCIDQITSPPIGNPYGLVVDGKIVHPNSMLNHARAELILGLCDQNAGTVLEVGGGYGALGYALFKTGFSGTYLNFDLPENLLVASYYLSMTNPEKKILMIPDNDFKCNEMANLEQYDIVMMPQYMISKVPTGFADICVNTISFSEMDYASIDQYVREFARISRRYIYHENMLDGGAGYCFFPEQAFPPFRGFKKIYSVPSRWPWFSLSSTQHHHGEWLFEKCLY